MTGKINSDGVLEIKRGASFNTVYCPFASKPAPCGDWCALFSEPEADVFSCDAGGNPEATLLTLCKITHSFSTLDDLRSQG